MLCAPSARNAYIGSLSHNSFAKPKKKKKSGGNKVVRNRSPSESLGVFNETGCLKSDKVASSALLLKRPSCCSRVELLVRVSILLERTCEEFWAKTAVTHFQYEFVVSSSLVSESISFHQISHHQSSFCELKSRARIKEIQCMVFPSRILHAL